MSSCPLPWFPIYAVEMLGDGDFQSWTPGERGCWITLSARCWADGSIPEDLERMAKLCGCNAEEMLKHWSSIACKFVNHSVAGRLVSPRIELERDKAIVKAEKIHGRAMAGSAARWRKEKGDVLKQCLSNASPMLGDATVPSPSPSPITTPTPSAPLPGKKPRKVKGAVSLGDYPEELFEAVAVWKDLFGFLGDDEIKSKFKPENIKMASRVGKNAEIWSSWEKRLEERVRTHPITHGDILESVKLGAEERIQKAKSGVGLFAPMLSTFINSVGFVDSLVSSVELRIAVEKSYVSNP